MGHASTGHFKKDCTFEMVCLRYRQKGHAAKECKRPHSPLSEDELQLLALAKVAHRGAPVPRQPAPGFPHAHEGGAPLPSSPPCPQLPAMHPWPTLWLTPGAVPPQSVPETEVAAPMCEVGCTSAMDGLSGGSCFPWWRRLAAIGQLCRASKSKRP
jgi:hypothetical protein